MADRATPLPLRIRLGLAAVLIVALGAIAAGTAAVQYGAWALDSTSGGVFTGPASTTPRWVGYDLNNRSAVPITLRAFVPREQRNVRILDTRVVDVRDGTGFGVIGAPLPADLAAKLAASVPVDGFVLPAGSRAQYEVIVLVRQTDPGEVAELGRSVIAYRALGLDQGASYDLVARFRAS